MQRLLTLFRPAALRWTAESAPGRAVTVCTPEITAKEPATVKCKSLRPSPFSIRFHTIPAETRSVGAVWRGFLRVPQSGLLPRPDRSEGERIRLPTPPARPHFPMADAASAHEVGYISGFNYLSIFSYIMLPSAKPQAAGEECFLFKLSSLHTPRETGPSGPRLRTSPCLLSSLLYLFETMVCFLVPLCLCQLPQKVPEMFFEKFVREQTPSSAIFPSLLQVHF